MRAMVATSGDILDHLLLTWMVAFATMTGERRFAGEPNNEKGDLPVAPTILIRLD